MAALVDDTQDFTPAGHYRFLPKVAFQISFLQLTSILHTSQCAISRIICF